MIRKIECFVDRLNGEVKSDGSFIKGTFLPTYSIARGGRKYSKVVMLSHDKETVWGFIDNVTGQIFKAHNFITRGGDAGINVETCTYGKNYSWRGPEK